MGPVNDKSGPKSGRKNKKNKGDKMKTKEKIREIENKGEGCDICEEAHRADAIYFIDADNVVFCNFCAENM